jgi:hypothetical protein
MAGLPYIARPLNRPRRSRDATPLRPLPPLALLLAVPALAHADGRVASATGVKQLNGEKLYVDVVVVVPSGKSARMATDKALSQQGARRVKPPWAGGPGGPNGGGGGGGEQYFYTGLVWNPPSMVQNYTRRASRSQRSPI